MITADFISCQELVELVTDYLEGALDDADLRRFEEHLAVCENCEHYLDQLRATIRIAGTVTLDDLSADAESTLLAAFRDWKRAQPPVV
ncbi:MAG: zf-HC2 domain-containing protein [Gaiellaceae bacterium]